VTYGAIYHRSYSVLILDKIFILVVIHHMSSSYCFKHFTDINIVTVQYKL